MSAANQRTFSKLALLCMERQVVQGRVSAEECVGKVLEFHEVDDDVREALTSFMTEYEELSDYMRDFLREKWGDILHG